MNGPKRHSPQAEGTSRDELEEAFIAWAEDHGLIWFDVETRLAEAVAAHLGIDLKWGGKKTKVVRR